MKISQAAAYGMHALMFMVRHITQLPVTSGTIAKAEGIPAGYLAKVLRRLSRAGFIRSAHGSKRGYVFARAPEEITLLELLDAMEGGPFLDDCPLRHCECGGTPENCRIYAQWISATRRVKTLLDETTIAAAAWSHPEHRFHVPPARPDSDRSKVKVPLV